MLQNYFVLNRFIIEANSHFKDAVIEDIFSQEKSKIVLAINKEELRTFLEISATPGNSFINFRKNYSRSKKNTLSFFSEALTKSIEMFEIAKNDRIIKIKLNDCSLYFTIRGKFTNFYFLDHALKLNAFKSVEEQSSDQIRKEFEAVYFIHQWNEIVFSENDEDNYLDEVRKKYPIFGSEIIRESKSRMSYDSASKPWHLLKEILNEVRYSRPCVFIDKQDKEIHLGFEQFKSIPFTEKKEFDTITDAQNYLLSKKYFLEDKYSKEKLIRNYVDRELKKVTNKIQNLQGLIEKGSKEEDYNKYGNLLLANINSIKSRMKSITVDDIFADGKQIRIDLNPALSPQKNIDYYFEKSRNEKIAFTKNQQLFESAKRDFENLKSIEELLDRTESSKELDEIMNKLKIKHPQQSSEKEDISSKFKHYVIENKFDLYVGKDSKNNDLLTTKFAKQNDYWFHARGMSGSHVVLRLHNTKEPVPKSVLKKAASIAAFHSKAKTAGIVPVAYTFKKYVVKKKGDPVGTVHLLREDVLLVKPEIPNECEYVSSQD
jgi:predicted ribosome quality control (RQC) complex YloA/Tae2 family protein